MAEISHEDFLKQQRQGIAGNRHSYVNHIEGPASEHDAGTIKDVISYMGSDNIPRIVEFIGTRYCDCGAMLDNKVHIAAKAQCCQRLTCTLCNKVCLRCKKNLCPTHSTELDGQIYCSSCAWYKRLAIVWSVIKKVVK